jgi:hypothetical protein
MPTLQLAVWKRSSGDEQVFRHRRKLQSVCWTKEVNIILFDSQGIFRIHKQDLFRIGLAIIAGQWKRQESSMHFVLLVPHPRFQDEYVPELHRSPTFPTR